MKFLQAWSLPFLTIFLLVLLGFSYWQFVSFQPQDLPNQNGIRLESSFRRLPIELPNPEPSAEISSSNTSLGAQKNLSTTMEIGKVYVFYKNVFAVKEWEIKNDTESETGFVTVYKKGRDRITVTLTKDTEKNQTIVSLDYTRD